LILQAACLQLAAAVLLSAAIGFLRLGAPASYSDWGMLLGKAGYLISQQGFALTYWNTYVFPGVFLSAFVAGWILLGEGFMGIVEKGT
jgi:ABC-type dipeptide/oligopeptide/nickel transport system permease subunit